jgi:hypothetical protein
MPNHPHTMTACSSHFAEPSRRYLSEIIAWRLRLFVPTAEDRGPAILAALFERHPLLRANPRAAA